MEISQRQYRRLKRKMNVEDGSWKRPRWRPSLRSHAVPEWKPVGSYQAYTVTTHIWVPWRKRYLKVFGKVVTVGRPKRFVASGDEEAFYRASPRMTADFGALNSGLGGT